MPVSDERFEWHPLDDDISRSIMSLEQQKLFPLEVAGKKICIVRIENQFLGINNRCPHAGTPFHLGTCNKKGIVVCPTHHYKFDMKTGLSADGNHYKLPVYQIVVEAGKVWIGWRKIPV